MFNEIIDKDSLHELAMRKEANSPSSVAVGTAQINQIEILCIQFDRSYKMGTIGIAEGRKIAWAFERATKKKLPVVAIVVSGGVRVHEGTPALIQMINMAAAVKKHSNKGLLYISIVTDPTLGGASASFVSLADIIIGEKDAIYGFSGKRVIEKTTHERLPDDFQTVQYASRHGMVDIVVEKTEIKPLITRLLLIHKKYKHSTRRMKKEY